MDQSGMDQSGMDQSGMDQSGMDQANDPGQLFQGNCSRDMFQGYGPGQMGPF